jgi:hypothetical protein
VLPPLPDPVEIKPAPVSEEKSYKLPEPASSLRVGGGGRFLILNLPKVSKLAVFDVNEAKIVRYIPTPEGDVQFAAGMTKLVVYAPGSKVIQRYNLLTGDREQTGKLDLPTGRFEGFCIGHASAGPLLVSVNESQRGIPRGRVALYDIETFQEIPSPKRDRRASLELGLYWAGATGRVLGHTGDYGQPNGVKTVVFEAGRIEKYGEHKGTWFVMPGPDDRHIYAGGHGVVSTRVKPVDNVPFSMGPNSGYASHLYLPAHHGPYYLHAQTIDDVAGRNQTPRPVGAVSIYMLGDKLPIATYDNTVVCKYGWEALRGFGIEYSLHLIPQAKLLVIIPGNREELHLYPADLEKTLDKLDRSFLVFTSSPPGRFEKGKVFRYQAQAHAKKMPISFKIESGPKGMTVNAAGLVEWTVPANFADPRVDVILAARDSDGKDAFQTFSLTTSK